MMEMTSDDLKAIQQIIRTELGAINVSITTLSGEVSDLNIRVRAMELSNASVITEIKSKINQLQTDNGRQDKDMNQLGSKIRLQSQLMQQLEQNTVDAITEVCVTQKVFDEWEKKKIKDDSEKWKAQDAINQKNDVMRAGIWFAFSMIIVNIVQLAWQIYLHGGLVGYVQYLQGGP